ncbi:hypothetical protein [Nonomuraea cypriaca]|nr:hypothetical protein [Nonomuraea cypriaca]
MLTFASRGAAPATAKEARGARDAVLAVSRYHPTIVIAPATPAR